MKINQTTHKIVYRLSALGDLVLVTGILDYWAAKYGWSFTVITKSENSPVLSNNPHIHNIIKLNKKDLSTSNWFKKAGQLANEYKDCELIDLHSTLRSRILSLRWKGPVSRYCKFSIERRLFKLTRSPALGKKLSNKKVIERYVSAVEQIIPPAKDLTPTIYLTEQEKEQATITLQKNKLKPNFIALHPYATHKDKAWPVEYWHALIEELDKKSIPWVIIGKDTNPLKVTNENRNFTNKLSLRETCGILNNGALLITGDSGPMHLASAVQLPVIAMFGPTSEEWGFYPSGEKDKVLEINMQCRPCTLHGKSYCKKDRKCLRSITPENVLKAMFDTLRVIG